MATRITNSDLQKRVDLINKITNNPAETYSGVGAGKANVGNYHLSFAYGGVELCQVVNESGGTRDVFSSGHITKRALYEKITAFINGLETANKQG